MKTATQTLTVTGTELADTIQQHLAEGWQVAGQTTLTTHYKAKQ